MAYTPAVAPAKAAAAKGRFGQGDIVAVVHPWPVLYRDDYPHHRAAR